jgi:cytochrome c oxidase assembly protein subunit 15
LSGFKRIYWWEWAHRLLGRLVGVVFFVPFCWFWLRGMIESHFKPRLIVLLGLGGLQGAIGWWMVASGLVDRVDVSQYRLAVHLTLAAIIFSYALWLARAMAPHSAKAPPSRLVGIGAILVIATIGQLFLGALVAGLDAGLAFNDWPSMDGAVVPGDLLILEPVWRNFFENPKTVQFDHRLGGYLVVVLALAQLAMAWSDDVDAPHRRRTLVFAALALGQMTLGVATLMLQVPLDLALAHQFLAFVVLGFAVAHWRGLLGAVPAPTVVRVRS